MEFGYRIAIGSLSARVDFPDPEYPIMEIFMMLPLKFGTKKAP